MKKKPCKKARRRIRDLMIALTDERLRVHYLLAELATRAGVPQQKLQAIVKELWTDDLM